MAEQNNTSNTKHRNVNPTSTAPSTPVAVITGAGRRFGLHMTESLLAQGWRVIALTRRCQQGALADLNHDNLICIEYNALDDSNVDAAIDAILHHSQHIDLVLHNASVYEKDAPHANASAAFYDDLFAIHMKLPARLNMALSDALKRSVREQGNVIHITDIYVDNPNPDYALYCSTKAGSENLMKSFAKLLAPRVRVNAIQPGPVKFLAEHTSAQKAVVLAETLLASEGGFDALERAIYAILDNHYMTGSVLRVDGGRALA